MQEEDKFDFDKSRASSLKGFFRTFFWLAQEEWHELDHKLFRISMGLVGFAAMALFWLFFLRSFSGL